MDIGPNVSLLGGGGGGCIRFPFELLSREGKVQSLVPTSVIKVCDFGSRELT